jgi:hypothetical protein
MCVGGPGLSVCLLRSFDFKLFVRHRSHSHVQLPATNPRHINQKEQLARRFQGICGQFRQCCEVCAALCWRVTVVVEAHFASLTHIRSRLRPRRRSARLLPSASVKRSRHTTEPTTTMMCVPGMLSVAIAPGRMLGTRHDSSNLPPTHEHARFAFFCLPLTGLQDGEQSSLMAASRREESERQQQLRTQVRFNQDMIVEREEGMKEIESAVTEINDIFRDLSLAVQDQGQMLGERRG